MEHDFSKEPKEETRDFKRYCEKWDRQFDIMVLLCIRDGQSVSQALKIAKLNLGLIMIDEDSEILI